MKDFNSFMYDHTRHCGRKHFCRYCLQAFNTEEVFKRHFKGFANINVKFKNYERKIKSPFMIYKDFESILVLKDNGKENHKESCTQKYPKPYCLQLWL